ncbi:MAG: response regulator transcription factor [Chloroflexi bacterium]|nr:response regulator transcription factor [Chloroflexota bacterium]
MSTILVVDDELTIREVVRKYLEREDYDVLEADNGKQALDILSREKIDLMVLDIMLPELDGFAIADSLRNASKYGSLYQNSNIPIIMLTARTEEEDRLSGFEAGTDDYVVKPFSPRELAMRVKAVLKRSAPPTVDDDIPLEFGVLRLDMRARSLTVDGKPITLTTKEFELLCFMAQNPDQVFSRAQLLDKVWGYEFYGDESTVTVHIHRLRDKIESDPDNPRFIETVWGVGYKFKGV